MTRAGPSGDPGRGAGTEPLAVSRNLGGKRLGTAAGSEAAAGGQQGEAFVPPPC